MKETNPRYLALKTLLSAQKNGKYINLATDSAINAASLTEADKSLFTSIVYGVTERQITLDFIISRLCIKGCSHIEPRVMMIMRMGLYQLVYLEKIPVHAAVNESVSLCKTKGERSFVNAILRSYLRDDGERVVFPREEDGEVRYLSITYSYPEWICASLIEDYGYENAKGILAAFSNEPPSACLRINTLKTTKEKLKEKLSQKGVEISDLPYSENALRLSRGANVTSLDGFDDGHFFVQDQASQIASAVLDAKAGDLVIDTCACPGSKSFGAAISMNDEGRVFSFDLHRNKLSLVTGTAKRLGISIIEAKEHDGKCAESSLVGLADKVICDVPCSGLGVMAKKPDIRYKSEEDVQRLAPLGAAILCESSKYLKAGGVLVYSTCTLRKEENELTVKAFLDSHPDFSLCPFNIKSSTPAYPDIMSDGMLTLFPHLHGCDGFFVAKLIKNA